MRLFIFDRVVTVPTNCKTWGCKSCRDRVKRYVKMRMAHGISILGQCYLITVTYRMEKGLAKGVGSVGKDWAACTRAWWKSNPSQRMKWFRVPELTKKGQVHLHLIVGGIQKRISCCRPGTHGSCNHKKDYAWAMAKCRKDCIEHELAKIWYKVTGDSWVVDCREVWSPGGAGAYLFKYLDKGFVDRESLEALGFKRRWSCSRNWPAPERMEFVVTLSKGWQNTQFVSKGGSWEERMRREAEASVDSPYAMKVGTELARVTEAKTAAVRLAGLRRRLTGA